MVGNKPFAVMVPDEIYLSKKSCMRQILDVYSITKSSVIAVQKVKESQIHNYGVIKPENTNNSFTKIEQIVEKPDAKNAPSLFAVCGRYILNPSIFNQIESLNPDANSEVQLTDGIKAMLRKEDVYACFFKGEKYDCGSKDGFVHATIKFALKDSNIKDSITSFIRDIV